MESAILGLILDSSIAIDAERRRLTVSALMEQISEKCGVAEIAICSIAVAELVHGIHRAETAEHRERRRSFLSKLMRALPVYSITAELRN